MQTAYVTETRGRMPNAPKIKASKANPPVRRAELRADSKTLPLASSVAGRPMRLAHQVGTSAEGPDRESEAAPVSVVRSRVSEPRPDWMTDTHTGLVVNEARRFRWALSATISMDDLLSAGHLGVEHAKSKFDPARGLRFSTYAIWWVRHYLRRTCEGIRQVKVPFDVSRAAHAAGEAYPLLTVDIDDMDLPSESDDADARIDAETEKQDLLSAMSTVLNERQQHVVKLFHYRNMQFVDISKEMGITVSRVRQIYKDAIGKLRFELG